MECLIITGGSGFLGSYLCKKFSKVYKVFCVDIKFKKNFLAKKLKIYLVIFLITTKLKRN